MLYRNMTKGISYLGDELVLRLVNMMRKFKPSFIPPQ